MNVDDAFFAAMDPRMQQAFAAMIQLEKEAIANPDENRMVGHYWLRNPALAPTLEIRNEIKETVAKVKNFPASVHPDKVCEGNGPFRNLLLIGIYSFALGPQFVANALEDQRTDRLKPFFFDNTDLDGMDRFLASIGADLNKTLCIVSLKSGGTKETWKGMLMAKTAFEKSRHHFGRHSVAVTTQDSEHDKYAIAKKWLPRFPMWDWVGGRTCELCTVGPLPAILQGFDTNALLVGAKACEDATRMNNVKGTRSSHIPLAWFSSSNDKSDKNLGVLPYRGFLELFSKNLQRLLMKSLGKELDFIQNIVNQGIPVFRNNSFTCQHSYI